MRTYATLLVDAMDTCSAELDGNIPFIQIGGTDGGHNGIQLDRNDTPAEQAAWLRNLAFECEALARAVERQVVVAS
jgi:hypothetical protein